MKTILISTVGAVGIASFFCVCYSPKVTYAKYPTTAFAEVVLKNDASVEIVSVGESPVSDALMASLRNASATAGQFTVTDGKADYWMLVNGLEASRADTLEGKNT